jgi:hypothetical protein
MSLALYLSRVRSNEVLGISPTPLVQVKDRKGVEALTQDGLTKPLHDFKRNTHAPKLSLDIEYFRLCGDITKQSPYRRLGFSLDDKLQPHYFQILNS